MSSTPSRPRLCLASLPADVLLQILSCILVDAARSPTTAAVLRTCTALHELGTPLLHRCIDLRGYKTEDEVVSAWKRLFGWRGTLTDDGRFRGQLARNVVELRIGGPAKPLYAGDMAGQSHGTSQFAVRTSPLTVVLSAEVVFHPALLPRCTSLIVDQVGLPMSHFDAPSLWSFVATLPIVDFTRHGNPCEPATVTATFSKAVAAQLFGSTKQPWRNLWTVRMRDTVYFDEYDHARKETTPRLALSEWSPKVFAIHLPDGPPLAHRRFRPGEDDFYWLFLDHVSVAESSTWWTGLERVELNLPSAMETEFRHRFERDWDADSLFGLQKRILPMIVFVDGDGIETRLIE